MRKARDKEAWGMVGFCRDAEGPQEDSRIGWSLEAEILRHKVEWEAGRWARPRSRGFPTEPGTLRIRNRMGSLPPEAC